MRVEEIRGRLRILSRIAPDFARHHQVYDDLPHRIAKGFAVAAEPVDVGAQAQSGNNLRCAVGKRSLGGCLRHWRRRGGHVPGLRAGRERQHNNQPFHEAFPLAASRGGAAWSAWFVTTRRAMLASASTPKNSAASRARGKRFSARKFRSPIESGTGSPLKEEVDSSAGRRWRWCPRCRGAARPWRFRVPHCARGFR